MCQPESSFATTRAVTASPGLTAGGSTVIDHCTGFNFCAGRNAEPSNSNTGATREDTISFFLRSGGRKTVKTLFDALVDLPVGKLGGYANRVFYGVRVRPAMADNAHAPDSKQRSPPELRVVYALFEISVGGSGQDIADFPRDGRLERFVQHLF